MNLKRKCQVVMLITNEKAKHGEYTFPHKEDNKIKFQRGEYNLNGFNLYILSDEEIKEGGWVLLPNGDINKMSPTDMIHYLDSQSKATKKIIASTDKTLNLPEPSNSFIQKYIEAYNKKEKITKVMVEYESICTLLPCNIHPNGLFEERLKVDKNNQITITKVKDSWTREEVIEILRNAHLDIVDGNYSKGLNKWIEENL